ncbi:class I SAM-dependent methyltransferase [Chitinophaga arvensicola]|uniref:Methyltransferase domain-containing protein n=1 Tax=Chitinophaga arvensicola TaxID=29529 RepID=A0A1I0RFQ3_9BACT|nr:methyltransferase domain-containing protein [Chitinophaga arvensicola]SEW39083.1 Methyltransferase domain-containing protein [Chitinophaga arvensicola]
MKPLLEEKELIWSAVVANVAMNRERNASGINSYEKEFRFIPADYLEKQMQTNGQASWLDLCCGSARALTQTAQVLTQKNIQQHITLKGIDLLDTFPAAADSFSCLDLEVASVTDWKPRQSYDLVTCSHGLHYLGDKLKVIAMAVAALNTKGYFVAHLDLKNVYINGAPQDVFLKKIFTQHHLHYNARTRIISCTGPQSLITGLQYLGADDQAGPNYTGQGAVNSYYTFPS